MKTPLASTLNARMFPGIVFATLLAGSVLAPVALAQTKAPGGNESPVIELPKLEVRGERILPPPEKFWNYSRFQNFEVLSAMGTMRTRNMIRYIAQYVNVITTIFPQAKLNTALPLKIILCDGAGTFRQFGNSWNNAMLVFRDNEQIVFVINADIDPHDRGQGKKIKVVTLPDDWDYKTGLLDAEPDAEQNYETMDSVANFSMDRMAPYGGGHAFSPGTVNAPLIGIVLPPSASQQNKLAPVISGTSADVPFRYTLRSNNEIMYPGYTGYIEVSSFDPVDYALRYVQDRLTSYYFETFKAQGIPAWYETALRQIWGGVDIWNKNVFVAKNVNSIISMSRHTPLPMAQIFESRVPGLYGRMSRFRNPWYWSNQCYAFVHYCLYKHRTKLRDGFAKFLAAACRGPVDEALFKQCFNMSYKDMENALSAYSNYVDYDTPWFKFLDDPWPKNVTVRPATEAEVGRIKGETLMMAGNKFAAQQELIAPYMRKNTDPDLLGALGLHLLANQNPEKARKLLEAAYDRGNNRARVCIALANLRMASALLEERKLHGDGAKLTAAQVDTVLRPLMVALQQKPVLSAAYLLLAEVWKNSAAAPTVAQFNVLTDGCRAFPYNMELIYRYTNLMADYGSKTEAAAVAAQGLRLSRTVQDKRRFSALQAQFNPSSSPPAAPPSSPPPSPSSTPLTDPLSSLPSDPQLP